MDNRCIGVFDSGLGGLTAVKQLMSEMPNECIVYFGDTGRVPYGTRSKDTIIKYVADDIRFLKTFDIKMIVVACGTASSVALPVLEKTLDIPIVGVLHAASAGAVKKTRNGRIGVAGTTSTINSGAYERTIKALNPDVEVIAVPCPLFVPLVENGHTTSQVARLVAEEYLQPLKQAAVDTLILGCTHYPLLKDVICDIMGDKVELVDAGICVAKHAKTFLMSANMLCGEDEQARYSYYVSDDIDSFEKLGGMFLQKQIHGLVKKIDIEKY